MMGFWAALMLAAKETAVLSFAAAGLAGGWWLLRNRTHATDLLPRLFALSGGFIDKNVTWHRPEKKTGTLTGRWVGFGLGLVVALGLLAVFYSWGGRHWAGLADLLRAAPRVLVRATGEGHAKPWWYYLTLLGGGWSGWALVTLAAAGALRAVTSRTAGGLNTWLLYAIMITLLYSLIPYKTPWLALDLFLPLAVLAGAGAAALWGLAQTSGLRRGAAAAAVVLACLMGHDTWQRGWHQPAEAANPYAYAHTSEDLLRLPPRLARLAGPQSRLAVVLADPWPLPWYLRNFAHTGYWRPGQDPGRADFYLTSAEVAEPLRTRLAGWRPEYFGVRPGVLLTLWTPPGR